MPNSEKICVVGLGYVGLPLLIELASHNHVVGFDIKESRISELKAGYDNTGEVASARLTDAIVRRALSFVSSLPSNSDRTAFIVTVPTPIDDYMIPDFEPIKSACALIGSVLKPGNLIIFESTVYPGATEEICVPELEKYSGLKWKIDFNVGYSPERINPGDAKNTLPNIIKIVSGDTEETLSRVSAIYDPIIKAGLHRAKSIKVAEAAKVIENIQRDVNIALVNEIAIICSKLGLSTTEVLNAASTKWNFLNFKPGLVGGHCIGVDPYYLAHKAKQIGYFPELLLAGRRLNESMVDHVVHQVITRLIETNILIKGARVAILGITFKENCPDTRNSKAYNLKNEFLSYGCQVDLFDPYANVIDEGQGECFKLDELEDKASYDVIIVFSPHDEVVRLGKETLLKSVKQSGFLYDLKSIFEPCDKIISL